ncbi:MAG: chemotaxis protein CheX [Armatimonadota bacterium]
MNIEYIEPFIKAAFTVITQVTGDQPSRESVGILDKTFTSQPVTILVGVTGDIEGHALYGMSIVTAIKLASAMVGEELPVFSEMAASAVSELANMLTGHASAGLAQSGRICDITPPTVLRGMNIEISTSTPALMLPIRTKFGKIDVNISLTEGRGALSRAA